MQRELARIHGIELTIDDEALTAIAEEAVALGTGARGLQRLIGRVVDSVDARWSELAEQGVTQVVISRACALSGSPPEFVKGERALARRDDSLRREALADLPPRPRPVLSQERPSVPEFTDTEELSDEAIWNRVEEVKRDHLSWSDAAASASAWWTKFETENRSRPALVLRLVLRYVLILG